jgi:carboxypeptidase family protein
MLSTGKRCLTAVVSLVLLPSMALAQAAITGVVKDTSGGVLPGVTVEAASPALIEKVRSVVTDDTGQYRIVNLLPGTYSVTFTLPGFSTVKREGVELSGTFVATVNGDLRVGALEETITVTGETPTVDVQSVRSQQTVSKEVLAAIPTARTAAGIQALIPGMLSPGSDVGGASGNPGGSTGSIHGGRPIDSRTLNDGISTNHAGGGGGGGNNANTAGSQEIVVSTSGGLGEAETGGVTVNLIPREGSNVFSGTVFVNGANGSMQGSNYTQDLKDRGLTAPSEILKVYDFNPMGGGRIIRDKLWFYLTERIWGADNTVPGMYVNKNAGNPNAWTYEPDLTKQAFTDIVNKTHIARLTWQALPRHKFSAFWNEQYTGTNVRGGGSATSTIESTGQNRYIPSRVTQGTWSSPVTSRLLMEAGYGSYNSRWGNGWQEGGRTDGTHNPDMIRVVEQGGSIPGLAYRFPANFGRSTVSTRTWRASLSYVTGAHNMKFGYFGGLINPSHRFYYYDELIAFRFRDGVPNQLTVAGHYPDMIEYGRNLVPTSFYGQDQWTSGRLTLQGGVRYDHFITTYPEQRVGGTPLMPTEIVFPSRSTKGIDWDDVTPRMGVAYDLFGNGKTALKFNLGKYMEAYVAGNGNDLDLGPLARMTVTTTRSWIDGNKDYVPNCDLTNPAKNGECGPNDRELGKNSFARTFDPAWSTGFGNRPFNWEMGISVQQEVAPRVSVTAGFFRRTFGNWYMTDNRATTPSDYTPFSVQAPVDPRLPNGGNYVVPGLYNLVPEKVGLVDELSQHSSNFAPQTEYWNGVDFGITARLRNGFTMQGGLSSGHKVADNCEIRALLPEMGSNGTTASSDSAAQITVSPATPTNPYCRYVEPFLTQVRGLASYTIPRVDVQVSGTWQSNPGPELAANYVATNAVIAAGPQPLGRALSGGAANVTVNLVEPGTLYGDRVNQIDFRISKLLRFGRTRTLVGVDLYNLTNTDTPLTYNQTFVPGGQWLTPTTIMTARFFKLGVQFDF